MTKALFSRLSLLLLTGAIGSFSGIASAEQVGAPSVIRTIPDDIFWGKATYEALGFVNIAGRTFQFAPNILVRDERNVLVTQYDLLSRPDGRLVRFSVNRFGMVERLWLLTDAEALEFLKR